MAKSESKPASTSLEVDINAIAQALAAPFELTEVKFKPQTVSGNRALAVPFVDARVIQDRLDDVLGVMGWQDSYECLPDGAVVCRLRIRLGAEWITKEDVGGQSEQPDEGDRRKAAFSDALKRAAVKFGIGRYLYRLKPQWVDYDPQKRQFVRTPTIPTVQVHVPSTNAARAAHAEESAPQVEKNGASEKKTVKGKGRAEPEQKQGASKGPPANGAELQRRLSGYDERLAEQGLCKPGDLIKHVVQAGTRAGFDKDLSTWSAAAIQLAIDETKVFEARLKREPAHKEVA